MVSAFRAAASRSSSSPAIRPSSATCSVVSRAKSSAISCIPMLTCTCGMPARSAAASDPSSADSRSTTSGRHASIVAVRPGSAARASMRAKTSCRTTRFDSSNDMVGSRAMTGPISSGGASAKGSCAKPARSSAAAYDAGAATRTSCPAAAKAWANGRSGPQWPSFAVVANSTRIRQR